MKKILIGILIGICFIIACSSTSSDKSYNSYKSNDSVFISTIVKNSNFKIVEISKVDHIIFYKVYVTSKSKNGNYIHELLVTRYIGYNVTVTELSSYYEDYADIIIK